MAGDIRDLGSRSEGPKTGTRRSAAVAKGSYGQLRAAKRCYRLGQSGWHGISGMGPWYLAGCCPPSVKMTAPIAGIDDPRGSLVAEG